MIHLMTTDHELTHYVNDMIRYVRPVNSEENKTFNKLPIRGTKGLRRLQTNGQIGLRLGAEGGSKLVGALVSVVFIRPHRI